MNFQYFITIMIVTISMTYYLITPEFLSYFPNALYYNSALASHGRALYIG
jgi:hypothetical protein